MTEPTASTSNGRTIDAPSSHHSGRSTRPVVARRPAGSGDVFCTSRLSFGRPRRNLRHQYPEIYGFNDDKARRRTAIRRACVLTGTLDGDESVAQAARAILCRYHNGGVGIALEAAKRYRLFEVAGAAIGGGHRHAAGRAGCQTAVDPVAIRIVGDCKRASFGLGRSGQENCRNDHSQKDTHARTHSNAVFPALKVPTKRLKTSEKCADQPNDGHRPTPLTNCPALPIVPAMTGLFATCGICPEIIG